MSDDLVLSDSEGESISDGEEMVSDGRSFRRCPSCGLFVPVESDSESNDYWAEWDAFFELERDITEEE